MAETLRVLIETTPKKTFASAIDWPGLSRAGRDDTAALEALAEAVARYAPIAADAGYPLQVEGAVLEVVEHLPGDATTAFGAPAAVGEADRRPTDAAEAERLVDLVAAAWRAFDAVASAAPEELRKGPRGGGRDRTKIVGHVAGANDAYAGVMGIALADRRPDAVCRASILRALREPSDGSPLAGRRWPPRYAARRVAWHAIDHAWEVEDRSEAG